MIDVRTLSRLPKREYPRNSKQPPDNAWISRDRRWIVQAWADFAPATDGTPWEGTICVAVKHTRAKNAQTFQKRNFDAPIAWDDLQAIKEHLWPGRIAIEIFPPADDLVDIADMRWIWVLPPGASLPMTLQDGKDTLTSLTIAERRAERPKPIAAMLAADARNPRSKE